MTHNNDFTLPSEYLELISEQGMEYLPELLRIMINAAMQREREKYLGVERYGRSPERQDYANGFKPKIVKTRLGEITFAIPQV